MTALFFESAGKRVGAFPTNLLRIFFGSLLLCGTLYLQSRKFLPTHASLSEVLWLGSSGIVGLAIGDGALFLSLVILGSRLATLLLSLAPPITVILAWFFLKEKLSLVAIVGILLTIWGIFWVVGEKQGPEEIRGSKTKGVVLGIISALGQAVGLILAKQGLAAGLDSLSATILRMVPAALVLWIFASLTRQILPTLRALKHKTALVAVLFGTVFGPYLGVWLANVSIKYTQAGIASTLLATVPILVIPMVIVVHRRTPSLRAIIGTIIAVAGIAIIFLR